MDLYWKRTPLEVEWFEVLMASNPDLEFFQPSPIQAPWHVQCRLDNGVLINFWPHAGKAMIQDEPPVATIHPDIVELLHDAKARIRDDFEPFDDEDKHVPSYPTQSFGRGAASEETIPF